MDNNNVNNDNGGNVNNDNGSNGGDINYESLYQNALNEILELTSERNSLLSENNELRTKHEAALNEAAKTKEINYTLSRQLNIENAKKREPEAILADMFLSKGGK